MAILTKFLKLLKPERNDYVDAEKHLSENYDKIDTKMEELSNSNDEKLNKGAVSSEYDTAKKIEDKIKEAKRTADGKVSKTGDAMTGQLVIDTSEDSILLKEKGVNKCAIGNLYSGSASGIYNHASGKGIVLRNDGRVSIDANNLNTNSKEVVAAINELNSRGFVKIGECLRVNQTVSVSGYNEFIVCEKFSPDKIIDIKYFTKNAINSLKNFAFLSYSSELECEWKFSSDRNIITLTKLGSADDGGIYVYGR